MGEPALPWPLLLGLEIVVPLAALAIGFITMVAVTDGKLKLAKRIKYVSISVFVILVCLLGVIMLDVEVYDTKGWGDLFKIGCAAQVVALFVAFAFALSPILEPDPEP